MTMPFSGTENSAFLKRVPERKNLKTPFLCAVWMAKNGSIVKTMTSPHHHYHLTKEKKRQQASGTNNKHCSNRSCLFNACALINISNITAKPPGTLSLSRALAARTALDMVNPLRHIMHVWKCAVDKHNNTRIFSFLFQKKIQIANNHLNKLNSAIHFLSTKNMKHVFRNTMSCMWCWGTASSCAVGKLIINIED